jgi:hypothetical protein
MSPASPSARDLAEEDQQPLGLFLCTAGVVFSQRQGKEIWYETVEDRVRCQWQGRQLSLTVSASGGGVAVTLAVGNTKAGELATDGTPMGHR